ncbi:CAP domain-containing protein [Chloroflexus sp.]|uniref:CAP domain-containing protein n=1 Tax=Chloroflexus sp. TaxID=1904827 RepID=UPI002ADE8CF8|nr:CAP domain-containing protein [Chloroflexus sp.]
MSTNALARPITQTTTNTVFIPIVTNPLPPLSSNWLERVNGYRLRTGVPPVTEDTTLNSNCFEHARYMAENNYLTHNQDPSLPFSSTAGQICAQHGNAWIGWGSSWEPADAIDGWMASVGHRLWLLYPTTQKFGFGFYTTGNRSTSAAALDVLSYFNNGDSYPNWPVRYPAPNQTDIPPTQFPITVHWRYFGDTPIVSSTALRVVGGGNIAHSFSTLLPVGHKGIVITPTLNLPPNTLIEVSVNGSYASQPFSYTWQFQTGSGN